MQFFRTLFSIFIFVLTFFGISSRAFDCVNPNKVAYTITVDLHGHGNFSKVGDAIKSIPSGNKEWIQISLNPGIYREQVLIPRDKSCILLKGTSMETTSIEWGAHTGAKRDTTSATFRAEAENFVARDISFKNTYDYREGSENKAMAADIHGDKSSFYSCGFYGVQDTLCDAEGRHFFKECYIEGAVDFIWGAGQSIYKKCKISVVGDKLGKGISGFITAQGRNFTKSTSGFVFIQGTINGTGTTYLGRAYGNYSRVIFHRLILPDIIVPDGWSNFWHRNPQNLELAESSCQGPGSDMSKRVRWEKKLSPEEVEKYTHISFIDDPEKWIPKQPN